MRKAPIVAIGILAFLGCEPSRADPPVYTVVSGAEVRIIFTTQLNPDCSSTGQITIRVTGKPSGGTIYLRNEKSYSSFPDDNSLSECNKKRVPGVGAYYKANDGFVGADSGTLEMIFPDGYEQTMDFQVIVK